MWVKGRTGAWKHEIIYSQCHTVYNKAILLGQNLWQNNLLSLSPKLLRMIIVKLAQGLHCNTEKYPCI